MAQFASKGVAGAGLGLGIAGTALGVLNANGCGNGILGNLFGNNRCCGNYGAVPEVQYVSHLQAENAQLKAKNYSDINDTAVYQQTLQDNRRLRDQLYAFITPLANESASNRERVAVLQAKVQSQNEKAVLREQLLRKDVDLVAQQCSCGINSLNAAVAGIQSTLCKITDTIVPSSAICPQPMPLVNTWVAPASTPPTNVNVLSTPQSDCHC